MSITGDDDGLPPCPVRHAAKAPIGVFVRNISRFEDIKSLLQVHSGTECLLPGACEHGASQFGLGIVPLPERTQLDRSFDRETVAVFWSIDCYK